MPELRKDPVTERWVIIAVERGKRPSDFGSVQPATQGGPCPFCYGHEQETPPEILAYREDGKPKDSPDWWIRVVPNKFPALQIEGNLDKRAMGVFDRMNGVGAHEVIIETPDHDKGIGDMTTAEVGNVLRAYRERMLDLQRDPRFRYTLIFKNWGEAAGASLEHPHSQLICTPTVPKQVVEEIRGGQRYYEFRDRCVYCDIVDQETAEEERTVTQNDQFVVYTPYASSFPFEMSILPKRHGAAFYHLSDEELLSLANILREALARLDRCLKNPPYNYVIHTCPYNEESLPYCHWHIEIIPRLTKMAGFEWGTGFYINPTPPEMAAQYLRDA